MASIASNASGSSRETGAVTPGRPRGDQERDRIAEDGHRRREHDRGQRLPVKQPGADVGHHRVPHARPPGTPASRSQAGRRERRRRPSRPVRPTTSGMDERTGDGSTKRTAIVSTTWTTCPAVRSQTTARSPRPTSSTSRPWLTPRWTSPATPPGSVRLRNSRPVVGRDGGGQGQSACRGRGQRSSTARHSRRW